jgi:predicted aminopeptidase
MPSPPPIPVRRSRRDLLRRCCWRALLFGIVVGGASGCTALGYYAQAVAGHFEIWRKQQAINALLDDPALPGARRAKLELVNQARAFAHQRLALPDNGSYRDFVELERDFVVWNVFVAPPLALDPDTSCFPLVGCLAYRGYFDPAAAERYATRRRDAGFDVYVAGVAAYSTLGWFDDPVLSTFLNWSDARLLEILFHELAHQQLYVKDDTTFNESFAMAVAASGLELWFAERGESNAEAIGAAARERELMALVLDARVELASLYATTVPAATKLEGKARVFASLQQRYGQLKAGWHGRSDYDRWMGESWNNAKMASIATYHDLVPAFRALIDHYDGDFAAAYAHLAAIAALKPAPRLRCLGSFASGVSGLDCPGPSGNF